MKKSQSLLPTFFVCFLIFLFGFFLIWSYLHLTDSPLSPSIDYSPPSKKRPVTPIEATSVREIVIDKQLPSLEEEIVEKYWNQQEGYLDFSLSSWMELTFHKQREYASIYQRWYSKKYQLKTEKNIFIAGARFSFALIPPGKFWMGSPSYEHDELGTGGVSPEKERLHRVIITQPFYIGTGEVSQRQWQAVMGSNPAYFRGEDLPVESVSWQQCQEFCRKTGLQLPTEAQWEYACRAGTDTAYNIGTVIGEQVNYAGNSTVASKSLANENAWGCYDFHGNVWEWCRDLGTIRNGVVVTDTYLDNIRNPFCIKGDFPIFRGGSVRCRAWFCRSATRNNMGVYLNQTGNHTQRQDATAFITRFGDVGLRVVLSVR